SAEALSSLLQGHEDQVALLQAAHKEALTRKDGEYQVALRRASDELSGQRTRGEQLEGELERSRRERAEALSALGKAHEAELALLQASHTGALAGLEGESQAALRRASDELSAQRTRGEQLEGELERSRRERAEALSTLGKAHEAELASLQASHSGALAALES